MLFGCSQRAVSRQVAKLRVKGVIGIKHGNYGRAPVNKKKSIELQPAIELAKTVCAKFSLKHCHEKLGIRVIPASSAQAKGRIERSFRTMQERLVPDLGLLGITGMTDANRYLDTVFLPSFWNARLSVLARDEASRYRPLAPHQVLDEILCFKHSSAYRSPRFACLLHLRSLGSSGEAKTGGTKSLSSKPGTKSLSN